MRVEIVRIYVYIWNSFKKTKKNNPATKVKGTPRRSNLRHLHAAHTSLRFMSQTILEQVTRVTKPAAYQQQHGNNNKPEGAAGCQNSTTHLR